MIQSQTVLLRDENLNFFLKKNNKNIFLDIITNGDFLKIKQVTELYQSGLNKINVSMYDGPEQIKKFKDTNTEVILGIDHHLYNHATKISKDVRSILMRDFI